MRKFVLVQFLFLWTISPASGQKIIQGTILGQQNKKPIPFANIGIINSNVGTISNEDGSFSIQIPHARLNDTLVFSALGYRKKRIPIHLIKENKQFTLFLSEKITTLEEVIVTASKEKRKTFWLGNKYSKGGNIYADSVAAGSAMALLIENKYPAHHPDLTFPVYIEKALLRISVNTFDEFKVRVRILEMDTISKLPGKDLFNESIVVNSRIKSGWLTFDLSAFNIKIDRQSFFLAFEWILEDKDRLALLDQYKRYKKLNPEKVTLDTMVVRGEKVLYYNWYNFIAGTSFGVSPIKFSLDNYQCYYRNNSFGEWKRAATILTARLLVSNQPSLKTISANSKVLTETRPCQDQIPVCEATRYCEDFLDEYAVNGMQLSVSLKGKTVLSRGFGYSDIENDQPVNTQTRFRIGSVSKSLTSAALVKLVSENKLDLDVPVQRYVSSYPEKKFTVNIRQVSGHLAGIRHYQKDNLSELIRKEHYTSVNNALSIFKNDSLLFQPGSQYLYSSYGWNLIGAIIEGASGQNYLDYMYNNIWKPLSMVQTYGDIADSLMINKSKFYLANGEEAEAYDLSYKYPSGGLVSTTDDLVKFGNELLYGNYLDTTLKKQLFETQYTTDKKATNYGIGWNLEKDKNGHRIWFHAGDLLEGSAYLILYPDDDLVVAFLANSREGLSFDIQKIGELFYKDLKKGQ